MKVVKIDATNSVEAQKKLKKKRKNISILQSKLFIRRVRGINTYLINYKQKWDG